MNKLEDKEIFVFRLSEFDHVFHSNSFEKEYWYVDLGEEFAVKMFVIAGRQTCCGQRSKNLELFVGDEQPIAKPLDKSKFRLCGKLPYEMPELYAVNGMTCSRWIVGRYAVIENNKPENPDGLHLQILEAAVYGFKLSDFWK